MKHSTQIGQENADLAALYYKTAVIVRKDHAKEGEDKKMSNYEVLLDTAFGKVFDDANKSSGKTSDYSSVQTCIKSKLGVGEPIIVLFYAPLNWKNPSAQIEYAYRKVGDDVDLIQNDEYKYCLKQCYKMAYFMTKLHDVEILRMQCEFVKDENKTIWFSYASKIAFRRIKNNLDDQLESKQISYINKDH